MRLPLTHYGLRELIAIPLIAFGVALGVILLTPLTMLYPLIVAGCVSLAGWAFFRDFERHGPSEPNILLAPADGKITDIEEIDEPDFIEGPALRIGIFLSVFSVHVNRVPCSGVVSFIKEKPGKCLNAMRSRAASEQNQSICLGLLCPEHPVGKVMVKQITGAIARRIICATRIDEKLVGGQRYGMIKFGSRTELTIPRDDRAEILVQKGDAVWAGVTRLVRYPTDAKELES